MNNTARAGGFFLHDRQFYRSLFHILALVALQNVINYSVNMADNIMLGSYSQPALSGAATVNQIFFLVQQLSLGVGDAFIVLGSQYWGQRRTEPIRGLAAAALRWAVVCGAVFFFACALAPRGILRLFTKDEAILLQGVAYLRILKYTFIPFFISATVMAILRSVETVRIAFVTSIVSLVVNVCINYVLIYGRFGAPELGVRGAAIGTLTARLLELSIVLGYAAHDRKKLHLFGPGFRHPDPLLASDFRKTAVPVILSQVLWGISVPMQTAILGHLSSDAIAANSVATTFYQYLKVVVIAESSAFGVVIGMTIGKGKTDEVKAAMRTLELMSLLIALILGGTLYIIRTPLLRLYELTPEALALADRLIVILCLVMVGMGYEMPICMGCLRGGGDTKFVLAMNMISTWAIVMPLSFASAFWWKWPVAAVVICIQSDQIFKCLPTFVRARHYNKWIKKLTR